jgi:hypothetical protein
MSYSYSDTVQLIFSERIGQVFKSTVLGKIFGPKRGEVIGESRKLPNARDIYVQFILRIVESGSS